MLLGRDDVERLLAALAPDYVSLLPNARKALRQQAMVFVQDTASTRLGLLLADTSYDALAIQCGRDIELPPGVTIRVCSSGDSV